MIQDVTAAGLASIFPAMPSTGSCALPDFESALFAMLGVTAEPESPSTTPNPQPAQPTKAASKTAAAGSPAKNDKEHADDEKKPAADHAPAPAAVLVPLPIATPLPVQANSAALTPRPTPALTEAADCVPAQAAPFTASVSAASAPSSAIAVAAASQHRVAPAVRLDASAVKSDADDSAENTTKETSAPVTELDKAPAPAKPAAHENLSDAAVALPYSQLAARQTSGPSLLPNDQKPERILEPVKAQVAQFTASDPSATAKAVVGPSVGDTSLPSAGSNANANPVPVPQPAAQSQLSDVQAQPASINAPVVPVNLPAKSDFGQAASGNSGHNSPAGKFHPPAANPSPDRPSKEKASHATTSAETKPDAPSTDAAKAVDPAAAAEPASPKAQPELSAADALPPQAPRAELVSQADASDASPQAADASPAPAQPAPASAVPLPAEHASEALFSSAQLIEKVSQSELRLGMRTGEFGNVEIRTTFDHQQLRAEISSERGELGQALSTELPGFEQRLRERDVPLSTVVVHQASAGASGGFDRPPRQQQQAQSVTPVNGSATPDARPSAAPTPESWEPEGILDIRI